MKPDQINYQPLVAIKHTFKAVLKQSLHGGLPLVALVIFILAAIAIAVIGQPIFLVYLVVLYSIYWGRLARKYKNNVWLAFAAANNWLLDPTPPDQIIPPSLNFGHSQHYSPVVQAKLSDTSCDLLAYDTTVGGGKSSHTYWFTLARVELPKALPHMLLLSKKGPQGVQRDLQDAQQLQLEGDFDDYFKLQIEKGQQIDALTVITPDVMQTLVQNDSRQDIEIWGHSLFFVLGGDKRDAGDVQLIFQAVTALSGQIVQNINLSTIPAPAAPVTPS